MERQRFTPEQINAKLLEVDGRWEQIRLKALICNDGLFERPIAGIMGADLAEAAGAFSRAATQNPASIVFDSRQANALPSP